MEHHSHHHSEEYIKNNMNRLSKAEGQLRHVMKMMESGADCSDILIQLAAVIGALKKVEQIILENHFNSCIKEAFLTGDEEAIERFQYSLKQLMK